VTAAQEQLAVKQEQQVREVATLQASIDDIDQESASASPAC
jgi:hypothetical protein